MSCSKIKVFKDASLIGTQRNLNFTGDGVTPVNNPGNSRIDIAIPGGGGGGGGAVIGTGKTLSTDASGELIGVMRAYFPLRGSIEADGHAIDAINGIQSKDAPVAIPWDGSLSGGFGLDFNGSTQYIRMSSSFCAEGIDGSTAVGASWWASIRAKIDNFDSDGLVGRHGGGTNGWFLRAESTDTRVRFFCPSTNSVGTDVSATGLSTGVEYNFLWGYDHVSGSQYIFVDGVEAGRTATSAGMYASANDLVIGNQTDLTKYFEGHLGQFIYCVGEEPSAGVIDKIYNGGVAPRLVSGAVPSTSTGPGFVTNTTSIEAGLRTVFSGMEFAHANDAVPCKAGAGVYTLTGGLQSWNGSGAPDGKGVGHLSGSGQYWSLPGEVGPVGNDDSDDNMTMFRAAVWVKLDTKATDQYIQGQYTTTGDQRGYLLYYDTSDDKFYAVVSKDGTFNAGVTAQVAVSAAGINTGQWYRIVWGWNLTHIYMFVDGVEQTEVAWTGGLHASTADYRLGADGSGNNPVDGEIWQAQLWSGQGKPTTAQVAELDLASNPYVGGGAILKAAYSEHESGNNTYTIEGSHAKTSITAGDVETIPSAATVGKGAELFLFDQGGNASANPITYVPSGSEKINFLGDAREAMVIDQDHGGIFLVSDGTNFVCRHQTGQRFLFKGDTLGTLAKGLVNHWPADNANSRFGRRDPVGQRHLYPDTLDVIATVNAPGANNVFSDLSQSFYSCPTDFPNWTQRTGMAVFLWWRPKTGWDADYQQILGTSGASNAFAYWSLDNDNSGVPRMLAATGPSTGTSATSAQSISANTNYTVYGEHSNESHVGISVDDETLVTSALAGTNLQASVTNETFRMGAYNHATPRQTSGVTTDSMVGQANVWNRVLSKGAGSEQRFLHTNGPLLLVDANGTPV